MSEVTAGVTRRQLVRSAGVGGAAVALGAAGLQAFDPALAVAGLRVADSAGVVPLPSAAQVRADFQRMVDFGPRLTGNAGHNAYIAWLEEELTAAGVELLPCSSYELTRWEVGKWELDLLSGPGAGPVKLTSYYPRCQETSAAGLSGPLVYGGTLPVPSINEADITSVLAGVQAWPEQMASWVEGLTGTLEGLEGSILVVDLPVPLPLVFGALLPISTYLNWPGHSFADWIGIDYKRLWLLPGLQMPLSEFAVTGCKGVVFILDGSYEGLAGLYGPFDSGFASLPAVYVDRDTGTKLRGLAGARPKARLTVTAEREVVRSPSLVGVIHGEKAENLILNSHTDGEGVAEENCGVSILELARHFGSLPQGQRLARSIVISLFTGHMDPQLPEAQGFINDNPTLVANAAAALTLEHFGMSEWVDDESGYHATGEAEVMAIWTTQGDMLTATRESVEKFGLPRTALFRPPVQFGVGMPFQTKGIPQIGAISGPNYLITIDKNSDMDKLDAELASQQIACIADLMWRLESYSAADLRKGDPTLGVGSSSNPPGNGGVKFEYASSAPPADDVYGPLLLSAKPVSNDHVLEVELALSDGYAHNVSVLVEHAGRVVARTNLWELGTVARKLRLRTLKRKAYPAGQCTLVVKDSTGKTLIRRRVQIKR
jgi:hypothetical protein